jgi:hypothetical protein
MLHLTWSGSTALPCHAMPCHADNEIFNAHEWKAACIEKGQGLSFAGVNACHQNRKAEKRIGLLQEQRRTQLIHANQRWPGTITVNLWPHALRTANESMTSIPSLQDKRIRSPIQIFSSTEVDINPTHFFHFGCPVHVLGQELPRECFCPSQMDRAIAGWCLSQTLAPACQHARQVMLALNLVTGWVLPQFHVAIDLTFPTMRKSFGNEQPCSHWQVKCGFVEKTTSTQQAATPPATEQAEEPDLIIPPLTWSWVPWLLTCRCRSLTLWSTTPTLIGWGAASQAVQQKKETGQAPNQGVDSLLRSQDQQRMMSLQNCLPSWQSAQKQTQMHRS